VEGGFFDNTVDVRVELVVVKDKERAEKICAALQEAGLEVKYWSEDALTDPAGLPGRGLWEQVSTRGTAEPHGPFHVRVWEENLAKAQDVLAKSGLAEE
jgi:hypothetical protein